MDTCEDATTENTFPLIWLRNSRSLAFSLDSFTYNGEEYVGGYAKVDSGVPQLLFPFKPFLAIYYDVLPDFDLELGIYTVDCSKATLLPDWTFTIGGKDYVVSSSTYVVDLLLPNGQCAWSAYTSDADTTDFVLGYVFHDHRWVT